MLTPDSPGCAPDQCCTIVEIVPLQTPQMSRMRLETSVFIVAARLSPAAHFVSLNLLTSPPVTATGNEA